MTSEEISRVISNALGPVTSSVDRMASSLVDFKLTTTQHLTEIRSDLRHVCEGHSELVGDVKQLREQWPLVESHMKREEDTQTFKLQQASTSKKSDPNIARISVPRAALKYVPWIVMAALAGAALVGGMIAGKQEGVAEGVQAATKYFTEMPAKAAASPSPPPPAASGSDTSFDPSVSLKKDVAE
jgi:hypothetical protein